MSAAEPSRSRSAGGRVCLSSNQKTSPMENGQWNHTNMQLMSNTPTGIYPTKMEIYAIPNTIDLENLKQKHHQPRAAEIKPLGDTYPNHSQTTVMIINALTLCYSSVARCGNGKSPLNEGLNGLNGLNGRNIYIIRVDLDCFAYCPESIPIEQKKQWTNDKASAKVKQTWNRGCKQQIFTLTPDPRRPCTTASYTICTSVLGGPQSN